MKGWLYSMISKVSRDEMRRPDVRLVLVVCLHETLFYLAQIAAFGGQRL